MTQPFFEHPPIFASLMRRYEDDEDFARAAPMRGFAAFLRMAEMISGAALDGAGYQAILDRAREAAEYQASLRIQRGPLPTGTTIHYLNSENNQETS